MEAIIFHFSHISILWYFRYLPEYMWRMKVQREGGDHFFEFLKILANKQLQEDNFEVHEVISSLMY